MSGRKRQPSSAPEALDPSDNVVVLLVDDQAMVGEAVRRALSDEPNIAFHYCARPAEAIAVAKEVKPTVILQDLVMPGIDGLELVRQYRQDAGTVRIPIIVMSTKDEPAVKSAAFAAGANDYLVKLPDRIELLARLRYHSDAYVNRIKRDAADCALRESERALVQANLELRRLTRVDGLTGLGNRHYFDEYFAAEWKRSVRMQTPLSVLMIDLDCFKPFNDTYGHLAGDEVLRKVAAIIQKNCNRSTDLAARYGGEEFVAVLSNTAMTGLRAIGETLCREVADLHLRHVASVAADHVTVSIGGASTFPQRGRSATLLIDAADKALYRAKDGGRNRLVVDADFITVIS